MERPSSDERPRGPPFGIPRGFLALVSGTLVLGVGHHVDHIVRGNHVGWPLTGDVNAFTFSLLAYPLIAVGFAVGFDRRRGHTGRWLSSPPPGS